MNRGRALLFVLPVAVTALVTCSDPAPRPADRPPSAERAVLALRGVQPVRVPRAVLIERAGITGVYVLSDGLARFRMVKPGAALAANQVEIVSGLTGEEIVVLGELTSLYDGRPVRTK